jgi:hypothetical protein
MKKQCTRDMKEREGELNQQCLVEAKSWADDLAKRHKSRESLLQSRIEELIKDV